MRFSSSSEQDTADIARRLAHHIAARTDADGKERAPHIFCLSGDLGAGKSVFCRAFIRHMAGDDTLDVPSPTFTLVQTYDSAATDGTALPVYHFDLYRLDHPDDAYELGIEDAFADGICLIEWPDKLGDALDYLATTPPPVRITLTQQDNDTRRLDIDGLPDDIARDMAAALSQHMTEGRA